MPQRRPSDTATTSRHPFWREITRKPRKECASRRVTSKGLVLDRLRAFFSSRIEVSNALAPLDLDAYALDAALRKALKLSERWLAMPPVELKSLVREIVEQVTAAADRIESRLCRAKIAAVLQVGERGQRPDLDPVVPSIEAKLRRAGNGKRLVIENGTEAEVNESLVELIKGAFAIRNQLLSGSDASIEAMSGRLGVSKCRLTSLMRLSYLAPDIVCALLEGRQPIDLTPTRLLRLSKDLPHDWSEQRRFSASPSKTSIKTQAKRFTSDDSKTALRDPAAVRAPHPGLCVSGWRRCVRRRANARNYRDYSGERANYKYAAI